ncbi:phosphatidylinositol-specific phospholipase C [Enterococcus hirae]|uniref:phosphatidylinositol-specific phospholipase C n=1 Tax=Enterococcus hirae TaxID=1354 RepID=UPI0018997663|nr:phosphatidylinositol-specific phospholipase C [Enterococcus hirae]EMF0039992.1 phosphatidylinositol-specific phospholipase C [Enterococcus hirae]EMF0066125.1 phosphatidylinositol-specific phospholipase C [Enterococcus hirae]EMF0147680.1 phosphatidylinositol-specific phospholipase C [Enterococcus hirae]EMF0188054.1 phosphatidylinositol-specific phospholipase C [Enterococcus hirae]EMF0200758.1 phosphatidylinositol-specific phospholipase C [Enterococcus hirae]
MKNMKNKKYLWMGVFLSTFTLMVFIKSVDSYAQSNTAYWNEGYKPQTRSGWMDWLPNGARVSQLSMPGTHDSMAWQPNLVGLDCTRTQTMSLEDQLNSGIRVIDIRVKYEGEQFSCYHGPIYLGCDLDDVLKTITLFLKNNPTEAVFMRFSQEYSSADDNSMKQLFDKYYNRYRDLFYSGKSNNPRVGDIRGKLVLISNVLSLNQYGLNYRYFNKQDDYHLSTNWDLYSKWQKIKDQLLVANGRLLQNNIYINYLSGSGGSFPYFVASGHSSPQTWAGNLATGLTEPGFHHYYPDFPRGNWFGVFATIYFEGTNELTANFIEKNKLSYVGIIMSDFPGAKLINDIIECNRNIKLIG